MATDINRKKIVQIAHGRIIPRYSSAYSLRCIRYLEDYPNRKVFSVGGLILRDETDKDAKQYRSLIMTTMAFLKGGRILEILLSKGSWLRRKYLEDLKKEILSVDIVIFEGPWQYRLIKELLNGKIVIYDAHNVEYLLRKGDPWEEYTKNIELDLVTNADHVITVSQEDAEQMATIYGIDPQRISSIPEGFESPENTWRGAVSKEIVFIGSAYLPNIVAAENVIELARKLPDFTFKIIGSVCNSINKRKVPKNVRLLGVLPDMEKESEICNSFVAINPVLTGSGRNLKMNDYVAHGIPIITTEIGARGFDSELKDVFVIADLSNFPAEIERMNSQKTDLSEISQTMMNYAHDHDYSNTKEKTMELINFLTREL